jgi:hypothetical protein
MYRLDRLCRHEDRWDVLRESIVLDVWVRLGRDATMCIPTMRDTTDLVMVPNMRVVARKLIVSNTQGQPDKDSGGPGFSLVACIEPQLQPFGF